MNRILCLILLLFFFFDGSSQNSVTPISQPHRIELPLIKGDENAYQVITGGEYLFVWTAVDNNEGVSLLKLLQFDQSFKIVQENDYVIRKNHRYIDHYYRDGFLYFLFGNFTNDIRLH